MLTRRERYIYLVTSLIGLGIWVGVSYHSGQPEAWDSGLFYGIGVGVMMLTAAIAGYAEPAAPWRWGISMVVLQPLALILMSNAGAVMLFGLLLFAVLAFLCMGAAVTGAGLKRLLGNRSEEEKIEA